eukprot:gnl/TRDRNA2_/TRDRNA2_179505_c0_seq1.p1 gnl/TRDRNA2_/TRDRNA2_179505_c0~~gnl/TRDRNA2_/TRDRNA2_179505_c0_seq1.p1  ORF type:complete len:298 (+),score=58.44 gnl/TRDRNA2_/TRDRNA2_179505_c0_seq1:69-962(+)
MRASRFLLAALAVLGRATSDHGSAHAADCWAEEDSAIDQDGEPRSCAMNLIQTKMQRKKKAVSTNEETATNEQTQSSADHGEVDECHKDWLNMTKSDLDTKRFEVFPGAKVIVDVGGNAGYDIGKFVDKFPNAQIFSYEPVPVFAERLQSAFANNPHVTISNFGLSDSNRTAEFNLLEAGSGEVSVEGRSNYEKFVNASIIDAHTSLEEVRQKSGQEAPDVLSLNCEGCEYSVLKRLKDQGWLAKIPYIQMSWHAFPGVDGRVAKRCELEEALRQTHEPVWWAIYGWQAWQRKGLTK